MDFKSKRESRSRKNGDGFHSTTNKNRAKDSQHHTYQLFASSPTLSSMSEEESEF